MGRGRFHEGPIRGLVLLVPIKVHHSRAQVRPPLKHLRDALQRRLLKKQSCGLLNHRIAACKEDKLAVRALEYSHLKNEGGRRLGGRRW